MSDYPGGLVGEPTLANAAYDFDWPLFGLTSDVRHLVKRAVGCRQPVVLGTLVSMEGGGPRPLGTQMAFTCDQVAGYFSGGCIESDLAQHATKLLASGGKQRVVYGRGSPYFDIRLLCGASIGIMLEFLHQDDLAVRRLIKLEESRQSFLWLSDGSSRVILTDGEDPGERFREAAGLARQSGSAAGEVGDTYWVCYRSRPRLFVCGRDPAALALARLSSELDIATILIRENGPPGIPLAKVDCYWRGSAADAFESIGVDERTAIVAANHDFEADHDVLAAGLRTNAGYIGAIGSTRYRAARLERLRSSGLTDEQLAKLEPSCGAFHAKTPWEMAISVLAQLLPRFSATGAMDQRQ